MVDKELSYIAHTIENGCVSIDPLIDRPHQLQGL